MNATPVKTNQRRSSGRPASSAGAPKMAEFVLGELRRQIVTGEIEAGENLPTESQLVARFGVSRTPIREAMRALEFEGLINSRQGARFGARVQSPSGRVAGRHTGMVLRRRGATLADVYQARMAIEPFAVGLLARSATPETRAALKGLHEAECAAVGDPIAWGRAAEAFHQAVVDLSGNLTLSVLSAQLHDIVAGQIAVEMAESGVPSKLADRARADAAHGRLLTLIEQGDGEKAAAFWRSHLEAAWPLHAVTKALSVDDLLRDRPRPES